MWSQAVEQLLQNGDALLPGGSGVDGAGDVQGALVKGADQYVRQGLDRLRGDRAGIHRRLEPMLEQAETVAVGKVTPSLPAEYSRAIQQQDPFDRWVRAGLQEAPHAGVQRRHCVDCAVGLRTAGDAVRDFGLDGLGNGGEQVGLVTELVVKRTTGHPSRLDDLLSSYAGVTTLGEHRAGDSDQCLAGCLGT